MGVFLMVLLCVLAVYLLRSFFTSPETPEETGRAGEYETYRALRRHSSKQPHHYLLNNVYIPRKDGTTAEIDLLYLTPAGIIVVECKNFSGYIFGNDHSRNWTATLYAGKWRGVEKYHFYNPIFQNNTHIKALKEFLNIDVPYYSLIVFSDHCTIMNVTCNLPNTYICQRFYVRQLVKELCCSNPTVLTDAEREGLYEKLLPLCGATADKKSRHIAQIYEKVNKAECCPRCGGTLVKRVATRGIYRGSSFWGCTNYPRCNFTKPIPITEDSPASSEAAASADIATRNDN